MGIDDAANRGKSVMSVASVSTFVLFGDTNSRSNSWRTTTHLAARPYRRRRLKRYRIGFDSAYTSMVCDDVVTQLLSREDDDEGQFLLG